MSYRFRSGPFVPRGPGKGRERGEGGRDVSEEYKMIRAEQMRVDKNKKNQVVRHLGTRIQTQDTSDDNAMTRSLFPYHITTTAAARVVMRK